MRSSTFSSLALLATSLLARDALAAPLHRRDDAYTTVVTSEIVTVVQQADGSFITLSPIIPAPPTVVAAPTPAPATPTPIAQPKPEAKVAAPVAPTPLLSAIAPLLSSAPSTPSSGGLSGKRGLPYNTPSLLDLFVGSGSKATWCYNWDSSAGNIPSGLNYVPMLHGLDSEHLNPWTANANKAIAAGSTHLQYINEPDMPSSVGGVSTSVQDAAAGYINNMMPFKGKAKIGSPAVSSAENSGQGLDYLKQFFAACPNSSCHFDFIPVHWYGGVDQVQMFKDHIGNVQDLIKDLPGNPKIWITEYGVAGTQPASVHAQFISATAPWLDSQDNVERYAYQWVADGSLVTGSSLNAAGKAFISV